MLAYEELKGSSGRQIFFRPKRYDAADLFAGTPPKVFLKSAIFRMGDISLTGTPEGLADVKAGDVIETEVEGVCCLINTIVDDQTYFATV